jgi:hypothetical protein
MSELPSDTASRAARAEELARRIRDLTRFIEPIDGMIRDKAEFLVIAHLGQVLKRERMIMIAADMPRRQCHFGEAWVPSPPDSRMMRSGSMTTI